MHSKRGKFLSIVMALALVACFGAAACAATLNAYTVMPEKYASQVFEQFTKDTGIKVNFIRFSSGEALARLTAAPPTSTPRAATREYSQSTRRRSRL